MFRTMMNSIFITTTLLTTSMSLGANMVSNVDDFKFVNVDIVNYSEVHRFVNDSMTIKEFAIEMGYDDKYVTDLKEYYGDEFLTADSGYRRHADYKIIGMRNNMEDIIYAVVEL